MGELAFLFASGSEKFGLSQVLIPAICNFVIHTLT